ncbi:M20 family metallopeptidase [Bowdeniella nasicola]|uniref:M20 family metallopeptidase n=1 Tax=Bowdeniella nasicola TaxID=208480 RepID=UPI001C9E2862|nr:M20 family metallopeptidase [Bowdeniella nasicola]
MPYDGFSAHVSEQLERDRATAKPPQSAFAGASAELRVELREIVDELLEDLDGLAADLHAHPETAFEEHRSVAALATLLESRGIAAHTNVFDVETAAVADLPGDREDGPGRRIAILSEYDALPGIGHACGHNVIAASGVGAFLALAALRERHPDAVPGRVRWLGTPAEEGHTGKEYMARGGAFDGLDAAIMIHPYGFDVTDQVWLGRRTLTVTFHGRPAHASAQPFMGINALDAANLAYSGIGLLRQHILPVDRIHAMMPVGGDRASIIVAEAQLKLYVRSKYPDTLRDLSQRIDDICRGAALMTGCRVEIDWDEHPPSLPVRSNRELEARYAAAMVECGRDILPGGVLTETIAASTDFGNVSYRVPGIHPLVKISAEHVALHTEEFAQAAASPAATKAIDDASYALAATALDFLADDELAAAVRADFDAAGGAVDVPSYFDPKD